MTHCQYCETGNKPNANGEHWIVKSIVPARINIAKCEYHKTGEVSPMWKAVPQSRESAERLAVVRDYLAEVEKDPDGNRLYIEDLKETIAMLTLKRVRS